MSLDDLTEIQKNLLIGSLLGDGGMSAPSSRTARFAEGHCWAQRGYTDWKAGILGDYVSNKYKATKRVEGRVFRSWNLATKTTVRLRPFYDLFYGTGKRVFPSSLPNLMTPFVLAIWYLDDGGIMCKYHPRITFGLDEVSLDRALAALRVLGFEPTVHCGEKASDRTITFPDQDRKFYRLIAPHVPPCMAYKLPKGSLRREQDVNARKLTVTIAQRLSQVEGLSAAEIARRYGVGVSTAKRRIEGHERMRMGRPAVNSDQ